MDARSVVTFFILAAMVIGCKNETKRDSNGIYKAYFDGLEIPLPNNYQETDLEDLIEAWESWDGPPEIIDAKVKRLESFRSRLDTFTIYADSSNINNTVMISKGPYLKIGKWTSQNLFIVMEGQLRSQAKSLGVDFIPVENKYASLTNGNQMLKIKFQWNNDTLKSFGTQYILNTKDGNGSYGFTVVNNDDDFEDLIKSVSRQEPTKSKE